MNKHMLSFGLAIVFGVAGTFFHDAADNLTFGDYSNAIRLLSIGFFIVAGICAVVGLSIDK
jgi:hypothetical protein